MFKRMVVWLILMLSALSSFVMAEDLGSVVSNWKAIGNNDTIQVQVFDDPDVPGVTCYLSSAKSGGITGTIGIATDSSDASVACRQSGPISLSDNLESGKPVFSESRSVFFKELHVIRFIDRKREMLVYMTYSDTLVDGSPKNSITALSYKDPALMAHKAITPDTKTE